MFPVPNICEYLTEESKVRVFATTERDDQGSKVNDFFQKFDNLYNEMRWQKKIRSKASYSESTSCQMAMAVAGGGQLRLTVVVPDDEFLFPVYAENKALFWFSRNISLWGSISFYLACLVNIAVAVFYPFGDDGDEGETLDTIISIIKKFQKFLFKKKI